MDRDKLKNRAERQASQKYAAKRGRLEAEKKAARKDYRTQIGASKGAAKMTRGALHDALSSLGDYNLSGRYLDQAQSELMSRLGDTQGMVKFEKANLRPELREQVSSINDQLATLADSEAAAAQSIYEQSVNKHQAMEKKQRQRAKARAEALSDALAEIRSQVASNRGPNPVAHQIERENLRQDPALRKALADYLRTSQGVDAKTAKKAVSIYMRRDDPRMKEKPAEWAGYAAGYFGDATAAKADELFGG